MYIWDLSYLTEYWCEAADKNLSSYANLLLFEDNWRTILGKGMCIDIIVLVSDFFFFCKPADLFMESWKHADAYIFEILQAQ